MSTSGHILDREQKIDDEFVEKVRDQ